MSEPRRASLSGLRRFTGTVPSIERCDLCGTTLPAEHGHLVALDEWSLRCACRACHLLFTGDGAGRYRAVPDRYLTDPAHPVTAADLSRLGIPVGTAFVFVNSDLDRPVAGYPSPAGVTECVLETEAWQGLCTTHPLLAAPVPDVEAVYLTGSEAFLLPIDACYRLAGEVRLCWVGLDGGARVREVLARFVEDLRTRSRTLRSEGV